MEHSNQQHKGSYKTFFIMLGCSFVAMYITMYLNTYSIDHVYFSLTRFYMTCLGISTMAVIMWFFMRKMYQDKKKNIAILLGSLILFVGIYSCENAKTHHWRCAVDECNDPHHSIAILTSERADIQDPEVKELAESIIEAQRTEIEEMKAMIKRLENEK